MKKLKNSNPSKFVRRVLSRTSNESNGSEQLMDSKPSSLEAEISSLKEQVNILQIAVREMQQDSENKERALANMAREKEKMHLDLKVQKRTNSELQKRIEEERELYFEEKKQYCEEMSKNMRNQERHDSASQIKEIARLKETLSQTMQANYNLSVKFLRMQNTKAFLKERVKTLEENSARTAEKYKQEVKELRDALNFVVAKQFEQPISPSNKKFLKIVRDNGKLVHHNLCLQLEMDNLKQQLDRYKQHIVKTESHNKLQYISSKPKPAKKKPKKTVRIDPNIDYGKDESDVEVVTKLYERNATEGTPKIKIVEQEVCRGKEQERLKHVLDDNDSRITLLQVSGFPSQVPSDQTIASCPVRTQSAPEIVQSSSCIDNVNFCDIHRN